MLSELLDSFYTLLEGFQTSETPYPVAISMITTQYSETLSEILTHSDPRFAIFIDFAEDSTYQNLLLDLCQLESRMVFTALPEVPDEPTAAKNLLELFKNDPAQYNTILKWLHKTLSPSLFGDQKLFGILHIQNDLILLIKKNDHKKYKKRLRGLSKELLHDVIHQKHEGFIDTVLAAPLNYLETLVELDISIVLVEYSDARILDILCEEIVVADNKNVLRRMALEKHRDFFEEEDISMLETALSQIPPVPPHRAAKPEEPSLKRARTDQGTKELGLFKLLTPKYPKNLREEVLLNTINLNAKKLTSKQKFKGAFYSDAKPTPASALKEENKTQSDSFKCEN